ncbi:YjzC family protein [Alicyclobacillus sp. SO9]|uniref:YjzC family protein n=1 Tax=Alicyclobacillus sp. SO9 TaxID=2665646 RepID=UPI0018E6F89C|nr:YjzC family protein [Alicyclobacillus sp. SO9]QQE80193.1 YjzC family protein [Alicyclobacillus sp. SO9]
MAQHQQFEPGWKAPNDGDYIEVGEHPDSAGIHDPQTVHLRKGESFPRTRNGNRKWARVKPHDTK